MDTSNRYNLLQKKIILSMSLIQNMS